MARTTAELDDILGAIVDQLIATGGFSASTCRVSMPDTDFRPTAGDSWATVWIGPGNFDQEQIDGGMATNDQEFVVTVYTPIMTDRPGEDADALLDASRGLIALRRRVLQSLWMFDPVDGSSNELLREPMRPTGVSAPQRFGPSSVASLEIGFHACFDELIDEEA